MALIAWKPNHLTLRQRRRITMDWYSLQDWETLNPYKLRCRWISGAQKIQIGLQLFQVFILCVSFVLRLSKILIPAPMQVQESIYLLDFQNISGHPYTFMILSAKVCVSKTYETILCWIIRHPLTWLSMFRLWVICTGVWPQAVSVERQHNRWAGVLKMHRRVIGACNALTIPRRYNTSLS